MNLGVGDFITVFFIALTIFLILDLIWLLRIAKSFYRGQLKSRLNKNPSRLYILLFYCLFIVGLTHFAIFPALIEQDYKFAFFNGALYGFFTYMTYNFTNLAVLKNWPKKMVLVDTLWGSFLTLNVASMTYLIFNILN